MEPAAAKPKRVTPAYVQKTGWEAYRSFKDMIRSIPDLATKVVRASEVINEYDPTQYKHMLKGNKYLIRNALKYVGYDYLVTLVKGNANHPWLRLKEYFMRKDKKYKERRAIALPHGRRYRRWKPYHRTGYVDRYWHKRNFATRWNVLRGSKYRKYYPRRRK
jgi:hypothetical protein